MQVLQALKHLRDCDSPNCQSLTTINDIPYLDVAALLEGQGDDLKQ